MLDFDDEFSVHKIITEDFSRSNTSLMKHEANKSYICRHLTNNRDGGSPRVDTGSGTSLDLSWLAASRALRSCLGSFTLGPVAASSRAQGHANGLIRHGDMQ